LCRKGLVNNDFYIQYKSLDISFCLPTSNTQDKSISNTKQKILKNPAYRHFQDYLVNDVGYEYSIEVCIFLEYLFFLMNSILENLTVLFINVR